MGDASESCILQLIGDGRSLEAPAREIPAPSKFDWNNDANHALIPVAAAYSQKLAKMIGRLPSLLDDSHRPRLFM